jgi:hypothetical protein
VAAPKTTRRIAESLSHDEGLATEAGYLAVAVEEVDEHLNRHDHHTPASTPVAADGATP